MEPDDSLPCLQEPITGPYSEPNESHGHDSIFKTETFKKKFCDHLYVDTDIYY
jgi:hypothetical protein